MGEPLAIPSAPEPPKSRQTGAVAHDPSGHNRRSGNCHGINQIVRATVTANSDDEVVHQTIMKIQKLRKQIWPYMTIK
jgi:hypothetical protein